MKFTILPLLTIIALAQAAKSPLEEDSNDYDKRPKRDLKSRLSYRAEVPEAESLEYERENRGKSNSLEDDIIKRPGHERKESSEITVKRNQSDSFGQVAPVVKKPVAESILEKRPLVRHRPASFDSEEGPKKRLRLDSSHMDID